MTYVVQICTLHHVLLSKECSSKLTPTTCSACATSLGFCEFNCRQLDLALQLAIHTCIQSRVVMAIGMCPCAMRGLHDAAPGRQLPKYVRELEQCVHELAHVSWLARYPKGHTMPDVDHAAHHSV